MPRRKNAGDLKQALGGRKHWTNVLIAAEELLPCSFMERTTSGLKGAMTRAIVDATVKLHRQMEIVRKLITKAIDCTSMSPKIQVKIKNTCNTNLIPKFFLY